MVKQMAKNLDETAKKDSNYKRKIG